MLASLYNKNVFSYLAMMETICFIDNDSFYCHSLSMFKRKAYITSIKKRKSLKIISDEKFLNGGTLNGNIYYSMKSSNFLFKYDILSKQHSKVTDITTNFTDILNNFIYSRTSLNEVSQLDENGKLINTIKSHNNISIRNIKPFKKSLIAQTHFNFEYKKAYTVFHDDHNGWNPKTFTAGKWDSQGDYLAVACTNYTKHNIQPKLKLLTTNPTDTEWITLSELVADYSIEDVKVRNGIIYVVDHNFVLHILDINCKEIKSIPLHHEVLCFDVSPNGKKLAYAYWNCIKVIDL